MDRMIGFTFWFFLIFTPRPMPDVTTWPHPDDTRPLGGWATPALPASNDWTL
jgi:hypothetical protein